MRRRGAPPPPLPATAAPIAAAAALLAAALLLAACAAEEPAAPPTAAGEDRTLPALVSRATLLGVHTRAALACGVPLSATAQDRAAAVEAAALRVVQQRLGGAAARDAHLASLAPPAFDPRRGGQDRNAWCAERRADIVRVGAWLEGTEGAAFAERASAVAAQP